ncbi:DUF4232 domain-containing protein [Luteimicrobium sp. NPDC057192]|uniref:DUF4232 domain-containing protein n=1 Tax=Luteimicrobium sp. NPDC057192 TaxID=3346042 RepID=UPI00363B024A
MRRSRTVLAGGTAVVVAALALAGCASGPATRDAPRTGTTTGAAADLAELVAARARTLSGVSDATVERPTSGRPRVVVVNDVSRGAQGTAELVGRLVDETQTTRATATPGAQADAGMPEIWLAPATPAHADVRVLAWTPTEDATTPGPAGLPLASEAMRAAYRLALTPGVVGVRAAGGPVEVQVARASDLAPVADVARAGRMPVEQVTVRGGGKTLAIADAPAHVAVDASARWTDDPTAPTCRPGDLDLTLVGQDAGLGHRALVVGATNASKAPCALDGYPTVGFGTLTHERLDVHVTHGGSYMATDAGAHRVVVPPHGRALAVVSWDASSTAPDSTGHVPATSAEVRLAVAPGAPTTTRPVTSVVPEPGAISDPPTDLDLLDGGRATVTAWAPGTSTFG